MNDLTILKEVRDLIERGWTQGTFARTEDGMQCDPEDEDAASWALDGAICGALSELTPQSFHEERLRIAQILISAASGVEIKNLARFNDAPDRTREEILAVIDRAIEMEGQE